MRQAWMFFERRGEGALALFRQMMPGDRKRELLQSERNIAASLKQSIPVIDSVQVSGQWPVDITQEEPPVSRKYIGNQTVTLNTPSIYHDNCIFGKFFRLCNGTYTSFEESYKLAPQRFLS